MPICPSCGTQGRPQARFCRACGLVLPGAGATTVPRDVLSSATPLPSVGPIHADFRVEVPPDPSGSAQAGTTPPPDRTASARPNGPGRPPWLIPVLAASVALLLVVVVAVVALGGGDGGSSASDDQPPSTTPSAVDVSAPTDVAVRVVPGSCGADECQIKTLFTDRSDGEERTVLRITLAADPDTPITGETVGLDGTDGTTSIVKSVAIDEPFCVQLVAVGGEEREASEQTCRIVTNSEALEDAEGLVEPGDLEVGQCVTTLPGDEARDQTTNWLRPTTCTPGTTLTVFERPTELPCDGLLIPAGTTGFTVNSSPNVPEESFACLTPTI